MPARNEPGFPAPDQDPNNHIVPSGVENDDALWMLLNTYADGEATPDEIVRVERLLRSDPAVAREFSFLELTSHSVLEFAEIDPPETMTASIFAATTRRITLARRVRVWWSQTRTVFTPTTMRIGAAALASGVAVLVLWPKPGVVRNTPSRPVQNPIALAVPKRNLNSPVDRHAARPDNSRPVQMNARSGEPQPADIMKLEASNMPASDVHSMFSALRPGIHAAALRFGPKVESHAKKSTMLAFNSGPASLSPTLARAEQRHMAPTTENGTRSVKPDDLGPDVDSSSDVHVDPAVSVSAAPSPASQDEPPTTVAAVSYKPGSISDKTRNAPPPYQSLYVRTQEAIRRQYELQQYGGYGKDAYNNIQRGEVGVSLVGGRF